VYLNGTEVYRNNMPTGTIAYNTLANATVDGAMNPQQYHFICLPLVLTMAATPLRLKYIK
jgi:hypothetical protein